MTEGMNTGKVIPITKLVQGEIDELLIEALRDPKGTWNLLTGRRDALRASGLWHEDSAKIGLVLGYIKRDQELKK